MTVDKRISYEMQGGKKPARNYLGKQKTVSNVPVKWKSGPDAPETELAYITKAEKDLILKKNLHGSLKNGPNTGPDGIMSLDSQGDYTRDRSSRGPQRSGGSRQERDRNEQHMREILTGQKNIGQTVKTGPKTRKYAVPEYVKVKQKDGTYKDKYIGSGYKSYGTPSLWGNLFSRGAPGYRGIKGMPAFWGKSGFETRGVPGQEGFGYYSDIENFGDTRGAMPFGIMGLIANAINKFKKPKDMSKYNKLQLVDGELVDDPRIDKIPVPGESAWSDGTFTWPGTTKKGSSGYNDMIPGQETKFVNQNAPGPWNNFNQLGTPSDNPYKGPGKYEQAETDYWSDKQIIKTPGGEIVIDSEGNEVVDSPEWTSWEVPSGMMNEAYQDNLKFYDNLNKGIVENNNTYQLGDNILDSLVNSSQVGNQNVNRLEGSVLDAQPKKGIMESISDWFSSFRQPETIVENKVPVSNYDVRPDFYPGNKFTKTTMETGQPMVVEEGVWAPKPGEWGYRGPLRLANGGLASLFTRRG